LRNLSHQLKAAELILWSKHAQTIEQVSHPLSAKQKYVLRNNLACISSSEQINETSFQIDLQLFTHLTIDRDPNDRAIEGFKLYIIWNKTGTNLIGYS